jgi:CheY-like chemotaxis protein
MTTAGTSQIRILSVDDHPVVRQGIAGLVGVQPDMAVIGEASNGREAIQQFRLHHPDVTLMDLQMPEMNGIDALIAIRNEFPEARIIIILTTYVGRCSDFTSTESRRSRLSVKEPLAQRALGHNSRCPCRPEEDSGGSCHASR